MSNKNRLGKVLDRCNALAGTSAEQLNPSRHDHDHEHDNINSVPNKGKVYRIPNPNQPHQDQDHENRAKRGEFVGVDKAGKPISKGRTSLAKIVNSDPTFLMAQDVMGIRPDGLTYHCKRLGIDRVRKMLLHFSTWQDAYFTNKAGYIMRVIQNAQPSDKEPVPTRQTEGYRKWLAENGHTHGGGSQYGG